MKYIFIFKVSWSSSWTKYFCDNERSDSSTAFFSVAHLSSLSSRWASMQRVPFQHLKAPLNIGFSNYVSHLFYFSLCCIDLYRFHQFFYEPPHFWLDCHVILKLNINPPEQTWFLSGSHTTIMFLNHNYVFAKILHIYLGFCPYIIVSVCAILDFPSESLAS